SPWRGSCISPGQVLIRRAGLQRVGRIPLLHTVATRMRTRGVEMKSALAVAMIAVICAAGHPMATTADRPLARRDPGIALTPGAVQNTGNVWDGKWQGTTVSGNELVLQLQAQGQRLTGRLTVGKQSANITDGKVKGDTFTITTGPIDGHNVDATGKHVGDG